MWRRITVKVVGLVAGGQEWETDREMQRKGQIQRKTHTTDVERDV